MKEKKKKIQLTEEQQLTLYVSPIWSNKGLRTSIVIMTSSVPSSGDSDLTLM